MPKGSKVAKGAVSSVPHSLLYKLKEGRALVQSLPAAKMNGTVFTIWRGLPSTVVWKTTMPNHAGCVS